MMEFRKPPPLRRGDCIGLVSTSSPVSPGHLDRLTGYLKGRGYAVKTAEGVLDRTGHLAGTAERRAADVSMMFADPEVALVLPVDGGTGAGHLVDRLDYAAIRHRPTLFSAFSNPSVLNNAILAAAGMPSVHGVSGRQFFGWDDVDGPTEADFWRMVSGPIAGTFPVISGVAFGHQEPKLQFPIGCRVEFDLRGKRPVLRYLEDLVGHA